MITAAHYRLYESEQLQLSFEQNHGVEAPTENRNEKEDSLSDLYCERFNLLMDNLRFLSYTKWKQVHIIKYLNLYIIILPDSF